MTRCIFVVLGRVIYFGWAARRRHRHAGAGEDKGRQAGHAALSRGRDQPDGRKDSLKSFPGRILWSIPDVTDGVQTARGRGGKPMKRTLVRYKTKPDRAQENQRLIESVFAELEAKSPDGIRYLVLRLDDGTFVHFVAVDPKVAVTALK